MWETRTHTYNPSKIGSREMKMVHVLHVFPMFFTFEEFGEFEEFVKLFVLLYRFEDYDL